MDKLNRGVEWESEEINTFNPVVLCLYRRRLVSARGLADVDGMMSLINVNSIGDISTNYQETNNHPWSRNPFFFVPSNPKTPLHFMRFSAQGFKAYFPNITITLIRSAKHRRPNEFVFQVPRFLTKFDIHQYLTKLYNLENITDIRTTNFVGRRTVRGREYSAKKTAVVTLKEELDERGQAIPFWKIPPLEEPELKFMDPKADMKPRFPRYK